MVIGSAFVAKSIRDGYTLLQAAAKPGDQPIFHAGHPVRRGKDFRAVSLSISRRTCSS